MAYRSKMNAKRSGLLSNFQDALNNGQQLNPAAYKNYKRLQGFQNQDQYQTDLANQKQQAADYADAQATAPQRALGGLLGPQSNYNFDQYAQSAGLPQGSTQAQYLHGLTPQEYGQGTGRPDWNMGQDLSAPNNQDFQNQFGYNVKDAMQQYSPEDFQKDYGQSLKDLSTQTGVSDFQKYSGNTGWNLGDQLKQFTGQDMENSPGYQFALKQGQQALDRTAASRGGALGGGQLKAQTQYAQDYAGTKFNDYFNQDMANKQLNLGEFNNYVNSDMNRKSNLLNQYNNQQSMKQAANGQALGAYQNWYNNTTNNQNRDLANFYAAGNYRNLNNQNVLNNYQQNWNNYENQRNTYGNYLMGLAQMGQNAAGNTAGMLNGQNNAMSDRFTGAASANAQNNWNNAMATNQAVQGGMKNISGLAGMMGNGFGSGTGGYMQPYSGGGWNSTAPVSSYNDINGPGLETVIA